MDEEVHFLVGVVDVEAGPPRGGKPQLAVHGHYTVMTGADGYAPLVKEGAKVVGVNVRVVEGDQAAAYGGVSGDRVYPNPLPAP